jgi:hypothetical protein
MIKDLNIKAVLGKCTHGSTNKEIGKNLNVFM